MDKASFRNYLKKVGYRVKDTDSYPIVYVDGDKAELSKTYMEVKMIAKNVGYRHSFGVKKKEIEAEVVDDLPVSEEE